MKFNSPGLLAAVPTPLEFTNYILGQAEIHGKTQLDPHFKPQWASCPHCLIDFDVIGATETYKEDTDFILDRLGLKVLIHCLKL